MKSYVNIEILDSICVKQFEKSDNGSTSISRHILLEINEYPLFVICLEYQYQNLV